MKKSMQMLLLAFGVLSLTLVGCNPDDSTIDEDPVVDEPRMDDPAETPEMDESTETPVMDESTVDDDMTDGE